MKSTCLNYLSGRTFSSATLVLLCFGWLVLIPPTDPVSAFTPSPQATEEDYDPDNDGWAAWAKSSESAAQEMESWLNYWENLSEDDRNRTSFPPGYDRRGLDYRVAERQKYDLLALRVLKSPPEAQKTFLDGLKGSEMPDAMKAKLIHSIERMERLLIAEKEVVDQAAERGIQEAAWGKNAGAATLPGSVPDAAHAPALSVAAGLHELPTQGLFGDAIFDLIEDWSYQQMPEAALLQDRDRGLTLELTVAPAHPPGGSVVSSGEIRGRTFSEYVDPLQPETTRLTLFHAGNSGEQTLLLRFTADTPPVDDWLILRDFFLLGLEFLPPDDSGLALPGLSPQTKGDQ